MNFPPELRYTKDHEWLRLENGERTAVVGITDFAQSELGDVVFVELEPVGSKIEKDAPFGNVEAVKTVSELFMPVSGTVVAHNDVLERTPERVNEDPYGDGWMIRIEISDESELASLLDSDAYRDLVQ